MCASGGKCEGGCREKHLNRKRVGLKDGNKKTKQGEHVWINPPHSACKSAYTPVAKRVYRKRDED